MTELDERHRRWLDREMPSAAQAQADLAATLAATQRRARSRWPGAVLIALAAIVVLSLFTMRQPPPAPPVEWGLRFDLHVAGRHADTDVRIRIAVRKKMP